MKNLEINKHHKPFKKFETPYNDILKDNHSLKILKELDNVLNSKYLVRLKLTNIKKNLYINNIPILVRNDKFGPVLIHPNAKLISGIPLRNGGSNRYPCISFKGGTCIVETILDHFPLINGLTEFKILKLEKLM